MTPLQTAKDLIEQASKIIEEEKAESEKLKENPFVMFVGLRSYNQNEVLMDKALKSLNDAIQSLIDILSP